MLSPDDRMLLLENLRPPAGYELELAVGTTFTLDLIALLRVPLAFAFFDWEDEQGELVADRLALFEAIRGVADRMTIFCDAGHIAVPKDGMPLFARLEDCVCEVHAPRQNACFHPKVWALKFRREGELAKYRLLVASRNLTFDRSWDTLLTLDGDVAQPNHDNEPLASFFEQLVGLGGESLPAPRASAILDLASELKTASWQRPPHFYEGPFFHHFGLRDSASWEVLGSDRGRTLAISPFVQQAAIEKLESRGPLTLVSRPDELDLLQVDLSEPSCVWCLADAASAPVDELCGQPEEAIDTLAGLHAKLFVLENGANTAARVLTGSANATTAGFERNVEFMIELRGNKRHIGIDAIIEGEDGRNGLRPLLIPYKRSDQETDSEQVLERLLDRAHRMLCDVELSARCETEDDHWRIELSGNAVSLLPDTRVTVRPVTLLSAQSREVVAASEGWSASFTVTAIQSITRFFAFEIEARTTGRSLRKGFVRQVAMTGIPDERMDAITTDILSKAGIMRYLLYLASFDPSSSTPDALAGSARNLAACRDGADHLFAEFGPTLLEALLRMLSENPRRLRRIETLVAELEAREETASLLPEDFRRLWPSIREVWLAEVHAGDADQ